VVVAASALRERRMIAGRCSPRFQSTVPAPEEPPLSRARKSPHAPLLPSVARSPLSPTGPDLGPAIAAVGALCKGTFQDTCALDWTGEEATMKLTAMLLVITLGRRKRARQ
jgi:hypothetical protein